MPNAQREYNNYLSQLKYWQRELRFRREARQPNAKTIARAERTVRSALHWVCYWRALANGPRRRQARSQWQLAHWSAFVVPTQFAGAAP